MIGFASYRGSFLNRFVARRQARAIGLSSRGVSGHTTSVIESLEGRRLMTTVVSGQTVVTNIGAAHESDVYTLNGKAGGVLMATVAETVSGSALTPQIELYSPAGTLLTYNYSATGTTVTSQNLPSDGVYKVVVRDRVGTAVGGYAVTPVAIGPGIAQSAGGDAGAATSASTRAGTLAAGDIDVFTLNGRAGGALMATISESTPGSALVPQIELYSPAGKLLTYNYSATGTTVTSQNLPADGVYTVVVRDRTGAANGGYAVTPVAIGLGITPDAGGDAGAAISAATRNGTLAAGDIDVFTLNGRAGGALLATISESVAGSAVVPQIELYSPAGKLLTYNYSATGTTVTSQNLPSDGVYTVVVRDRTGSAAGGYAVTPVAIGPGLAQDSGTDAGAAGSGVTRAASLGKGDIDVFTISAKAGGVLMATVAETVAGSFLTAQIELYSPAGKLLTYNYNATGTTVTSQNLPSDGVYTVVVRDRTGTGSGTYAITPVAIGGGIAQATGGDAGPISRGASRSASISTGDIDVHTISATAGSKLVLTATESVAGSLLTPQIELYSPAGKLLTYNYGASTTTITSLNLASTGVYSIVIRDRTGSGTGGYVIKVV